MTEHRGGCHCGNLRLSLRLCQPPEATPLRACGCSFCRAHNTRTTSDPDGSSRSGPRTGRVQSYRFGSGPADFFICRRCGVYIGAVCETAAGRRAVINVNCLTDRAAFTIRPVSVEHDHETTEKRLARRAENCGIMSQTQVDAPKPAEPEPIRLARSGHINTSAVRANLDDPLIHIRPICSRRRGFEEQEPNGFNAS